MAALSEADLPVLAMHCGSGNIEREEFEGTYGSDKFDYWSYWHDNIPFL